MKTPVYLIRNESFLRKRGNNLIVVDRGREFPVPINSIDYIVRNGNSQITSQVFNHLGNNSIPVIMTTWGGKMVGIFYPPETNFNKYRQEQYLACSNPEMRLKIAKMIILAGLNNKRCHALKLGYDIYINDSIIQKCKSQQEVMLYEARITKKYYKILASSLKKWEFKTREYNPPTNEINALISFSYSLLYSEIACKCYEHGLCPFMGFLHEMNDKSFALIYDISEIFKPAVDNFILELINQDYLNDNHFLHYDKSCFINNVGKDIVIKEWFCFIRKTYIVSEKLVSFREIIRREVLKIRDAFISGFYSGWEFKNEE